MRLRELRVHVVHVHDLQSLDRARAHVAQQSVALQALEKSARADRREADVLVVPEEDLALLVEVRDRVLP